MSISFNDFLVLFSLSSYAILFVYSQCTKWRLTLLMRLVSYLSKNQDGASYYINLKTHPTTFNLNHASVAL
jgi:hypothetical protein